MPGTLKKYKSDEANISQKLYNTIYEKVTRKIHKYEKPTKGRWNPHKMYRFFFKDGANPEVFKWISRIVEQADRIREIIKKEEYQNIILRTFFQRCYKK